MFLKATVVVFLGVVTLLQTSLAEHAKDFRLAHNRLAGTLHRYKRDIGLAKTSRAYKDYAQTGALQDDEGALAKILQDDDGLAETLQDDNEPAEMADEGEDGLAESLLYDYGLTGILQDDDGLAGI